MEVKGEKFLENIALEKEKAKLKERTEYLDSKKQKAFYNSDSQAPFKENQKDDFTRLDDIVLETNKNNKQKYIIFGFLLILLFLITIITIKFIQEPKVQNNFTNNNIVEDVQKDIPKITTKKINHSLDIDKIIQSEDTVKEPQETKIEKQKTQTDTGDIFGMEKEEPIVEDITLDKVEQKTTPQEKPIIVKQQPKQIEKRKDTIAKEPIKEIILAKKLSPKKVTNIKPIGYFIQVGAFTKSIDKKLINTLKKNNYTFILHKMTIKGRLYTKVLVGHYKTKKDALKDLSTVRKIVHNPQSYILRLK